MRVPITPKQEGTLEMRDNVLSSVDAQDMVTSANQVTDRKNDQLDDDAVLRPGIDTSFSPPNLNDSEMGSMAENLILIDEEQDKENSPPLPTTPFSERPTQPSVLMRSCPFGRRNEKVPDYVRRNLFE